MTVQLTDKVDDLVNVIASERGLPVDLVRGVAFGLAQELSFHGCNVKEVERRLVESTLRYAVRHCFDPDPPCEFCGKTMVGSIPPGEGEANDNVCEDCYSKVTYEGTCHGCGRRLTAIGQLPPCFCSDECSLGPHRGAGPSEGDEKSSHESSHETV
jgi:hypothetical protein